MLRFRAAAALALILLLVPATAGARPTVVLVHGGGWSYVGPAATALVAPAAARFGRAGYGTVSVNYRAGIAGLGDVVTAYDDAAARSARVCVYGESAGGHLALMVAAARPELTCVISVVGPTDLLDPEAPALTAMAAGVLGGPLGALSPIRYADEISARVLLAAGADDKLVPPEQATRMAAALGDSARTVILAAGGRAWMHGTARASGIRRLARKELAWLP